MWPPTPRSSADASPERHAGRDERVPAGHDAHGRDEVLRQRVLEQEAARAGAQRVVDVRVEVERREHEDGDGVLELELLEETARRLQPVDVGHLDVHEHDVRAATPDEVEDRPPVRRLAADRHAGLALEDRAEAGADEHLVVGDEDPDLVLGLRRPRLRHAPDRTRGSGAARHPAVGRAHRFHEGMTRGPPVRNVRRVDRRRRETAIDVGACAVIVA
jgi:hypothetical protein